MSFDALGLRAELLRAVSEEGYTEPTPVQRKAIPVIIKGQDIMAGAQTGTGKTAGFTLPLLQLLSTSPAKGRGVRALILTPTRELAAQVGESVATYGKYLPLKSTIVFGGVGINPQIDKLRRGVDILIATPGRLLDHVGQRTVDLSKVEILILDEADRMLDMGFIRDIRKIMALLPESRQTLFFSATFSDEIKRLADDLLDEPALIEVARMNTPIELVTQVVHPVDRERKRELLSHLIGSRNWKQVLVFTRTKHGANRLAEQLEKDGLTAAAIHGNKSQGARTKALADFKAGKVRVLVATDIAARGLDIDQLPHVVNFELPNVPEDYVHRIGRTGRAGNEGEAISLVCVDEHKLLRDIEHLLKHRIPQEFLDGYDPDPTIKAEPIPNGRNRGAMPGRGQGQRDNARPGQRQGQRPAQRSDQRSDQRQAPRAAPRHDAPRQVEGTDSGRGQVRTDSRPPRSADSRGAGAGQGRGRSDGNSGGRSDGRSAQAPFAPRGDGRPAPRRFDSGPRRSDAPQGTRPEADGNRISNRENNLDDDRGNRMEPVRRDIQPSVAQRPRRNDGPREVPALLGGNRRS